MAASTAQDCRSATALRSKSDRVGVGETSRSPNCRLISQREDQAFETLKSPDNHIPCTSSKPSSMISMVAPSVNLMARRTT
jgi:hypothetical protein